MLTLLTVACSSDGAPASMSTTPLGPTAGSAATGALDDEASGSVEPGVPTCADGIWKLAQGFRLARRVDYVADRSTTFPMVEPGPPPFNTTISSAGTPCETATNRENCLSSLELPVPFGRHLVTTEGDNVRVWAGVSAVLTVLGLVDTPAEAIYFVVTNNIYTVPCTATVEAVDLSFMIHGALASEGCARAVVEAPPIDLLVASSDGYAREVPQRGGEIVCSGSVQPTLPSAAP